MATRVLRNLVLLITVTGLLSSCASLLEQEPEETRLYSVDLPAGFEDSCVGGQLEGDGLPFPIVDESVSISEGKDASSDQTNSIHYSCKWEIDEDAMGFTPRSATLSVSVKDYRDYGEFNLEDPNVPGEVVIDSLDGWDYGYCALLAEPYTDGSGVLEGDECVARSSNMEVTVDTYHPVEIDMPAFMEELAPLLQQAFAKS